MKCKSCARFPFCTVQELCIHNAKHLTKTYVDYYIKRKLDYKIERIKK